MRLALTLVALFLLAGAGFIIAGINMLAGTPWAFIASGVALLCAATFLRSGLINNG